MTLKFQVGFPKEDIRFAPDYIDKARHAGTFLAGIIKLLTSTINVSGLTDDGIHSTLTIHYEEVYSPDATISGVMERAEQFARDFCNKIGIGAE